MARKQTPVLAVVILALAFPTILLLAQAPADAPPGVTPEDVGSPEARQKLKVAGLWRDLLHYINVANADAALSSAQAFLEAQPGPAHAYELSETTYGSMLILARGAGLKGLDEPLARIRELIAEGYKVQRTDPQRIKEAIARLDKGPEAFEQASQQLVWSGEYAVSYMVQALMDPTTTPMLKSLLITVLPRIGKDAVRPLSVALQTNDPQLQEIFAKALGQIEYPHALPRLKELLEREDLLDRTRQAAEKALQACAGSDKSVMDKPSAGLYYDLALRYYYRAESLLADVRYPMANVWYWREGLGLVFVPVPREILCDVYAMRMARMALQHDPKFFPAVSLWISAALDRRASLPAGQTDPLWAQDQPSPMFYSLASGPRYLQEALARALKDHNTEVGLGAIRALVQTAGTKSLLEPGPERAIPLVEALTYPDREVRFFAAISIASARPNQPFEGSQMVLPVLSSALRQKARKNALLIATEPKQHNLLKDLLRQLDYEVLEAADITQALAEANKVSGVDVAVLGTSPDPIATVKSLRTQPSLLGVPVVAASQAPGLKEEAAADKRTLLASPEPAADELLPLLNEALKVGAGRPLTPEESLKWAVEAAQAIRGLGQASNRILDISLTEAALIEALDDDRDAVRTAAAQALAVMDEPEAQQAIVRLGNSEKADVAVRVAAYNALSESVRRFGRHLTEKNVVDLLAVVNAAGPHPLREAAAKALGMLNLESQEIIPLILKTGGADRD